LGRLRENRIRRCMKRAILMLEPVQPGTAMSRDQTGPERIEQGASDVMSVEVIPYALDGLSIERIEEHLPHFSGRIVAGSMLFLTEEKLDVILERINGIGVRQPDVALDRFKMDLIKS